MASTSDVPSPPTSAPPPATDNCDAPESPAPLTSPSQPRVPSLRSISDTPLMAPSSAPLGAISAARRGNGAASLTNKPFAANGGIPKDLAARLQAFHASRMGVPPPPKPNVQSPLNGAPPKFPSNRPVPPGNWSSAPALQHRAPPKPSLAQRRMGGLPGGLPSTPPMAGALAPAGGAKPGDGVRKNRPHPGSLNSSGPAQSSDSQGSLFDKYSQYVDAKSGSLKFAGKAVLHGKGVDFSSGTSFSISLDEIQTLEELGKGNYGTVYKVLHRSSRGRRPSASRESRPTGLSPDDASSVGDASSSGDPSPEEQERSPLSRNGSGTTGVVMAMKEIRLELDETKFAQIIMELDVLHRCRSPYIIDFYGAFFQEGAVYICMEHMDGGSIDKLYRGGVPERVLRKIAYATVQGLKTLKDEHNIIHRDVKPTNILVNTKGEIKLCDFGVSGNLVASIAKTNIGCQSYMAPERIATGGTGASVGTGPQGTYGVQSDIWSLGLSLLECAMGCYPYPPETYNNIFSQLSAIVDGDPPDLPEEGFTPEARDFVRGCLHKIPNLRPTYAMLLQHPWIAGLAKPTTITEEAEEEAEDGSDFETLAGFEEGDPAVRGWVLGAIQRRKEEQERGVKGPKKPALHAAPLDAVSPKTEIDHITKGIAGV